MARKSFIKDAETLYIDCTVFDQKTSCVSNAVGDLDFKTAAFDSEDIVCGTESMCLLADRWHGVADTTVSYKNFCVSSVFPTMGLIKTSIVDEDNNLSGNIQTNDISDADKQKGTVGPFREQLLIMGINLEAIKRYEDAAASNKEPSEADLEVINKILEGCFVIEQMGEKTCLAYDISYINYVLEELEKSGDKGVLYGILTNMKDNMPEDGIVTTFKGDFPEFSVTVEKLGPGYQALINADSSGFGKDLKNFRVAYTATDKSSLAYFLNEDGSYNWDNITKWIKMEPIDSDSTEYRTFAALLLKMSDEDVARVLEAGQKGSSFLFFPETAFEPTPALELVGKEYSNLAEYLAALAEGTTLQDLSEADRKLARDNQTRAEAFNMAILTMQKMGGFRCNVEISPEEDAYGNTIGYTVTLIPQKQDTGYNGYSPDPVTEGLDTLGDLALQNINTQKITVYNRTSSSETTHFYIDQNVITILNSFIKFPYGGEPNFDDSREIAEQIITTLSIVFSDTTFGAVLSEGLNVEFPYTVLKSVASNYKDASAAQLGGTALEIADKATSMTAAGTVVVIQGNAGNTVLIERPTYDEDELARRVEVFNMHRGNTNVTVEDLKKSFEEDGELFQEYYIWYFSDSRPKEEEEYEKTKGDN